MKSKSTFRAYVTALLAPWIVGMKRILTDSNGYIQKSIDEVAVLSNQATQAATSAKASSDSATTSASAANTDAASAHTDAATVAQTSNTLTALLRSFATVWYGALASDPSTDANGNAPVIGAEYWNTTKNIIRVYTSSGWADQDAAALADARNAALSASQASTYATQAQTSATNASESATSAGSAATTSQQILDSMKAMSPSFNSADAGYFFRVSDDGTTYAFISPSDSLSAMGGAPLANPEFTGLPTVPTANRNTNTQQIASCAFVLNQASNVMPLADGVAAIGTSFLYARADHVHPSDSDMVSGIYGAIATQGDLAGIGMHYDADDDLITVGFRPMGSAAGANDRWFNVAKDTDVIHTSGGQIVGNLTIGSVAVGTNSNLLIDGPLNSERFITYRVNGTPHWFTGGDNTSLTGNNAGDNFVIGSCDDNGGRLRTNFSLDRQSGLASFSGPTACTGYAKVMTASGNGSSIYIDKPSNFWGQLVYQTGGNTRWSMAVPGDENGTSGADFYIQSWNGGNAPLDTPLRIYRNSGLVYIPRGVTVDGQSNTNTQGASNQSAYITSKLSSRSTLYSSEQYLEEIVGSQVRHVISVSSSSNNYGFTFNEFGAITAKTFDGTATRAEYADLAELYTCNQKLPPGTFVKIARDTGYDIEIAPAGSKFYFGVISTNPGYLLNSTCAGLPVALTGRVPALVKGSIYKGDPVTISKTLSGVGEYGESNIIGFALETNLDTGVKLVEVAVGGRGG